MTIWEKAIISMEKGTKKLSVAAATFSDRVKAELAIIKLRIRINEVESLINDIHRQIGRRVVDLRRDQALPRTSEQLMKDDAITIALSGLADREQELKDLREELRRVNDDHAETVKQTEETLS